MSIAKVTASEVFESLTGFDEVAIAKTFGVNPNDYDSDGNSKLVGTLLGRALVFVHECREGKNEHDAYTQSMSLSQKELIDYFAPEGDEESGKESTPDEPQPEISQPSA